jgi:hypothetical protein
VDNLIFKDKATAIELINQMENILSLETTSGALSITSNPIA